MLRNFFMIIIKFWLWLWYGERPEKKKCPKISLLIPFSSGSYIRERTFQWLLKYWKHELPNAEICIGHSKGKIFCKGEALNNAARKANGNVLVVLDADAYFSGEVISTCADRILEEIAAGNPLWYIPYRHLYRLTKEITAEILNSNPGNPLRIPSPVPREDIDPGWRDKSGYGHWYGAMIQIFPREALDILGCFDERFKGWGGEDIAIVHALDTLYARHKTTENDVLHLWHPFIGDNYKTRAWEGQSGGEVNGQLSMAYHRATNNPTQMRELVDCGCKHRQ